MKRILGGPVCLAWVLVLTAALSMCYADSAEVMPKGVFGATLENLIYLPMTTRYSGDGEVESVARDFNATLGSNIFPDLTLIEDAFGLPRGAANFGNSVVSFKYRAIEEILTLQYGLTDKLTVGARIPYGWVENDVSARLNTRRATVGINPFIGTPNDPFGGAPFIPLALGGIPLTTRDIKRLIGPGLDINGDGRVDIPGFGYKSFADWSNDGIEDLEVGFRYQYFKTDSWRLAFTGALRFPTGDANDPDNLVDIGLGNGIYTLMFRLNNDYTGIKNLLLNTTLRYELRMPDTCQQRVPISVDRPLTRDKEVVNRDTGDLLELEGSAKYQFYPGFFLSCLYRYGSKFKDEVKGTSANVLKSLEDLTDWKYHLIRPGIAYSTLPMFMEKKFPVPLVVSLEYEDYFAGSNRFLIQNNFNIAISVFF
ncbi:MAG: hypothetical protein AB9873_16515 [Syntrophobacteraceae bacterium]